MMTEVSDWLLYPGLVLTITLVLMYSAAQPWWKSWFGWSYVLVKLTVIQMVVRALLHQWYGSYPAQDLLEFLGRLALVVAMLIANIGLMVYLTRAWQAAGREEAEGHGTIRSRMGS